MYAITYKINNLTISIKADDFRTVFDEDYNIIGYEIVYRDCYYTISARELISAKILSRTKQRSY